MKLTNIFIVLVVAVLPFLMHGAHGRKNRWGCSGNSDCIQACRRTCSNFVRPLCYSSQCYCQAVGYLRNEYQRTNMNINEPVDVYDYDLKHI